MITFDEAAALVRQSARPRGGETIALEEAAGRVLAESVRARIDAPRADCSAMDGYAVQEADLLKIPVRLRVVGESFPGAGHHDPVAPGTCVRIFTGAPVPPGADRVVIQENVVREHDVAAVEAHPGPARHIRRRGSDFAEGEVLVEAGRLLDPRALVAAAAADVAEVRVARRPRIIILATGDELSAPGGAKEVAGAVPESVSFGIAALAADWGGETVRRLRLRDELAPMKRAAAAALDDADLVIVTGGASVGERDFAKTMFQDCGLNLIFGKVAIKPGKPVWLGRARGRLVMGLPGNPTSALVTARLLLAPLLAGMSGRDPNEALAWDEAALSMPLGPCGGRETFVRARREGRKVRPLDNQDSGAQRTLAAADVLVRRRAGAPAAEPGELVELLDF